MAEQRKRQTYTENLASINTALFYINTHLQNIDVHLERLNDSSNKHAEQIAKNTTWISAIRWIAGIVVVGASSWLSKLQGWW